MRMLVRLYRHLPKRLRAKLTRLLFKYDINNLGKYEFKLVETFDELKESLRITQEIYLKEGLSQDETVLRISKYNLLPSTCIFIAKDKKNNEIVATVSSIQKTSLGLPISPFLDDPKLITDHARASEIAALGVKEKYRSQSTGLFLMLTIYAFRYIIENINPSILFISVTKSAQFFYEDLFCFEQVGAPKKYEYVNNKFGVPLAFYPKEGINQIKNNFQDRPFLRNPFKIYNNLPWSKDCDFSTPKYGLLSKYFYSRDEVRILIQSLLNEKSKLSKDDLLYLKNHPQVKNLNLNYQFDFFIERKDLRFYVNQVAVIKKDTKNIQIEILEVSKRGLMIYSPMPLKLSDTLKITIENEIEVKVLWRENNYYGLEFLKDESEGWQKRISYFNTFSKEKVQHY